MRRAIVEEHWALRDISFDVDPGETVAVIGANGSGKSTLLALVARTSYPTKGTIETKGRIGPLLELGAGFHHNLTGLENIHLNAALLGLTDEQTAERLQPIIDYAGVGNFLDAPLHTYSTGMVARLGFAVLAHIDPDILLVDEALSVGDQEFQEKCRRTMLDLVHEKGTTMFLVSHDMAMVQKFCSRAVWIHRGKIMEMGSCKDVVEQYHYRLLKILEEENREQQAADPSDSAAT